MDAFDLGDEARVVGGAAFGAKFFEEGGVVIFMEVFGEPGITCLITGYTPGDLGGIKVIGWHDGLVMNI